MQQEQNYFQFECKDKGQVMLEVRVLFRPEAAL